MNILLCLYSDTGYFLESLAPEELIGRFVPQTDKLLFQVEAPAPLAGQLLCCYAFGNGQRRFLSQAARHRARFRVLGFSLGRCFYVAGVSLARTRGRPL